MVFELTPAALVISCVLLCSCGLCCGYMGVMGYLFKDMQRWISISQPIHHDLTSTWRCCMSDYRAVAVMQYKQLPYVVVYCPCMDIMCAVSCVRHSRICCGITKRQNGPLYQSNLLIALYRGGGLRSTIFRNFPQFIAISRNFSAILLLCPSYVLAGDFSHVPDMAEQWSLYIRCNAVDINGHTALQEWWQ